APARRSTRRGSFRRSAGFGRSLGTARSRGSSEGRAGKAPILRRTLGGGGRPLPRHLPGDGGPLLGVRPCLALSTHLVGRWRPANRISWKPLRRAAREWRII